MNKIKQNFRPLTDAQIKYLARISCEEKIDELRGMRLVAECSYHTLCINCNYYRDNEDIYEVLEDIRKDYEDLASRDLLKLEPNTFGCSFKELDERISKIIRIYEVFKSKNTQDFDLCRMFIEFYETPQLFRKQYTNILKNCSGDVRFDCADDALDAFEDMYKRFNDFYVSGYCSDVKHLIDYEDMRRDFHKASSVIYEYIKCDDSCTLESFLEKNKISKDEFKHYVDVVKTLNSEYYEEYLASVDNKSKGLEDKYISDLDAILDGISTGKTEDGKDFDTLEIVKLLPYKSTGNFYIRIKNLIRKPVATLHKALMEEKDPQVKEILLQNYIQICNECAPVFGSIVGALVDNDIADQFYFQPVRKDYYINSKLADPEEVETAYKYLSYYQIPASYHTVQLVIDGLRGGKINAEEIDALIKDKEDADRKAKESYLRVREEEYEKL